MAGEGMLDTLDEEAVGRYKEDAALVIRELHEGRVKLKHGALNPMGVVLLVAAMERLLRVKTVKEIVEELER